MTHRWMKFWPQDWEGDPALKACCLAAQGLWMRLVCIMHRADEYGHLTLNNRAPTAKQIAAMAGAPERDVAKLLAELQEAGVFSLTDDGVIYSRRMVRDKAAAEEARENGKRGGNPALKATAAKADIPSGNGGVNPPLKAEPNPPLKLLEAEADTERDISLRSISHARGARLPSSPKGFEEFWRLYPAKVGKAAARKAFPRAVQVAGGDPDEIVFGLKARLHLFPNEPQFIPNPATWLNQGRWEDDPDALFARSQRSN